MKVGYSTYYHECAASAPVAIVFPGTEFDERQFADPVDGKLTEDGLAALRGDVGPETIQAEPEALQGFSGGRP